MSAMKKSVLVGAAVLFVMVTAAGAGAQQAAPAAKAAAQADAAAQARAAIEATNLKFATAMVKGDAATAASMYTIDAIVMLPNQPAMKGSAAILAGITGMLKELTIKTFTPKTSDVIVAGEYAIETGTFEWLMQPKAGGPAVPDKGKYLTVWKKQADGGWKVVRDINNTDLPAGK
jgi:uncharacterized protein (TIGR02246 family)